MKMAYSCCTTAIEMCRRTQTGLTSRVKIQQLITRTISSFSLLSPANICAYDSAANEKKRNPQQINGHEKSGKRRTKQTNRQIIWFIGEWAGAWLQSNGCHINSWYADMRHLHSIICGREFGVQPHRSVYVINLHFSFVFHRSLWSKTFFGFVSLSWVVFEMATF